MCNAGGVTVSYFEWVQDMQQFFWDEAQVNQKLEELMLKAFRQVRQLRRGAQHADAHGGAEPGGGEGGEGEGSPRVVPVNLASFSRVAAKPVDFAYLPRRPPRRRTIAPHPRRRWSIFLG